MLPLVAFVGMNFKPMVQNGYLDPFIYTGYIHNFEDLVARYGATYYAVRFGFILPAQFLTMLFGPVGGFFAYRYFLTLLVVAPYFALVRQWHGRAIALGLSLVLVTSPYLARTLLWDYTDASGVPYVFASMCLVLLRHPRRRLLDGAAGICAGLALHSNFFAVVPLLAFLGTVAVFERVNGRPLAELATRAAWYLVPVAVISAMGAVYYWITTNEWDIFSVTFGIAAHLATGGTREFRVEGVDWVAQHWAIFTPVILLGLVAAAGAPRPFVHGLRDSAAIAGSAVATVAFYTHEFLLEGNSLQLFYYFSYCLPAVFVLLAGTLGRVPDARRPAFIAIFCIAAIGPWVLVSLDWPVVHGWSLERHLWVVVGALALTVLASRRWPAGGARTVTWAAVLGFLFWSCFSGGVYRDMIQSRLRPDDRELSLYHMALAFMDAVPPVAAQPGRIAFWYGNDPTSVSMDSVQSTFLWGYSKIQGDGPGMPHLAGDELERLRAPDLHWLVLLGPSESALDGGRAALQAHEIRFDTVGRRTLAANGHILHLEFLSLERD